MAKDKCLKHPYRAAADQCRHCGVPLCEECTVDKPNGVFCGEACWEKYLKFQDHALSREPTQRRSFLSGVWRPKRLVAIAVALFVLLLFMHYVYDVSGPGDLPGALHAMVADFILLFR
jgi:hypothetical protein